MVAVARKRAHLARPAPRLAGLHPLRAHEHVRPIDLINGAIGRPPGANQLFFAPDVELDGWLGLDAPRPMHAWYLPQIGNVLLIIDLIEEVFFVGIDVHAHHKHVAGTAGQASPPSRGLNPATHSLRQGPRARASWVFPPASLLNVRPHLATNGSDTRVAPATLRRRAPRPPPWPTQHRPGWVRRPGRAMVGASTCRCCAESAAKLPWRIVGESRTFKA